MKGHKRAGSAPRRIIKVGGLYRDTASGVTVTAEEHEMRDGHRTGRVLVCAADGKVRFPRRWYCRDVDLADVQTDFMEPIDEGLGVKP